MLLEKHCTGAAMRVSVCASVSPPAGLEPWWETGTAERPGEAAPAVILSERQNGPWRGGSDLPSIWRCQVVELGLTRGKTVIFKLWLLKEGPSS